MPMLLSCFLENRLCIETFVLGSRSGAGPPDAFLFSVRSLPSEDIRTTRGGRWNTTKYRVSAGIEVR